MESVDMDYLSIEQREIVLAITDHFTWHAQAFINKTQTVQATDTNAVAQLY